MKTATDAYDPTDEEIRELARVAIKNSKTPRQAALKLGICREATLGLAAGASVRPATFALVRQHQRNNRQNTNR